LRLLQLHVWLPHCIDEDIRVLRQSVSAGHTPDYLWLNSPNFAIFLHTRCIDALFLATNFTRRQFCCSACADPAITGPTNGQKCSAMPKQCSTNGPEDSCNTGCSVPQDVAAKVTPCDGQSLLFEAYVQPPNFDYSSLKKISKTVFDDKWNGWTPTVQHREIIADLYYANDAAFVQDIPEFKAMNNYVMRWRGTITVPKQGTYQFQTVSDDGSMLYLDEKVVVVSGGHTPVKFALHYWLTPMSHPPNWCLLFATNFTWRRFCCRTTMACTHLVQSRRLCPLLRALTK
jgi:hypothetical protein